MEVIENQDEDFTVYDNVFTREDAVNISRLFTKFKKSQMRGSHSYYKRCTGELANPIEYMIEEYLQRIGDTSEMVEYWYRSLWMDICCHQDLNEFLIRSKSITINPINAHIMYLSQLSYEAGTLLFNNDCTKVTTIYPKIGRLVRFKGNIYHYVPNPFDYIFGNNSTTKYNKPRHVLLFNTWHKYIPDPNENILKCKTLSVPKFKPINEWIKLNVRETVPLRDNSFTFRVKYMGDSQVRFSRSKIENFYVNRRFKDDGNTLQLVMYECKNVEEHKENLLCRNLTEEEYRLETESNENKEEKNDS